MTASFIHRSILIIGLLFLFHAAYSAAQRMFVIIMFIISNNNYYFSDRSYLRLNELDFVYLPHDVRNFFKKKKKLIIYFQITIQTLISLFIIMYGVLYVAGDFKEIKASAELEDKSWDTFRNIPSFYTFCHREGKSWKMTDLEDMK